MLQRRYSENLNFISTNGLAILKADPGMRWIDLVSSGQPDAQDPAVHNFRCPSCGNSAVRVGSTFEIPSRKDDKSWRDIERITGCGVDMAAAQPWCATVGEHKKRVDEALRLRARREHAESWEEKRRRIAVLGLVEREGSVDPALSPEPVKKISWEGIPRRVNAIFLLVVYRLVDKKFRGQNALKFRESGDAYFGDLTRFCGLCPPSSCLPKKLQTSLHLTSLHNIHKISLRDIPYTIR